MASLSRKSLLSFISEQELHGTLYLLTEGFFIFFGLSTCFYDRSAAKALAFLYKT